MWSGFCLMYCRGVMKGSAIIISICLTPFLLCGGCSREEPPPVQNYKVVMPIKRPAPEKAETSPTDEEKATTEAKEAGGAKVEAVEQEAIGPPETEAMEGETAVEEVTGYYIVKQGDGLSSIAAREGVYGDSLKWPILYRLNMDKLNNLQLGDGFLDRELPEGMRLKIITPDEARENLKRRINKVWVVNVLSATTKEEIVPVTIRLIKDGYPAYITYFKVKGKDWMRLRVGFFENKTEADMERKKIMTLLNLDNSWVSKVGRELEEFGGY